MTMIIIFIIIVRTLRDQNESHSVEQYSSECPSTP